MLLTKKAEVVWHAFWSFLRQAEAMDTSPAKLSVGKIKVGQLFSS